MSSLAQKTNSIFKGKLKGGALYIAIIVSIVIGVLLSMFILLAHYNQRNIIVFTQSTQLYYNLKSAFEIAQSDYFTSDLNDKWFKNTSNDDSLKVKKLNWGSFLLIHAQTKNRHQSLSQAGLYGSFMNADTALMVSDNSRPIGLSGKIEFKANCYLPKAGIKPAFIEGQSYQSSSQNNVFIRTSKGSIPEVNDAIIKNLKQQFEISYSNDSIINLVPDKLDNSFTAKTIVYELGSGKLFGKNWKNNIKLICRSHLELDSSCHLENILIVCQKVIFKQGFKGSVHVIASDSIITEKNCEFLYPSSFTLLANDNVSTNLKCIMLNEGCRFFGGIIAINQSNITTSSKVFVKLNTSCQVNGLIYSSDYMHIEGQLNATVIANTLLLKTPSAVYENHILGCEINPKKYSQILAVPLLFKTNSKLQCCKKVNT
ncbi:MAG: hypothetical protein Q7W45_10765 [Bacteroidota bacterium]|nr:hypothetical protein [Bacteroidota bacterium]MDP3146063.1 hypothetical protein [Bacteroidota bacterium]